MSRTLYNLAPVGHAAAGRVEQARLLASLPKAPPMEFPQGIDARTVQDPTNAPGFRTCPKCGKELRAQGAHFHIKACKG